MADKNLSVEEIIEQYTKKTAKKASEDTFDLDSFLKSMRPTTVSQKTEMIEDVLEIGDNSLVVAPEQTEPVVEEPPVTEMFAGDEAPCEPEYKENEATLSSTYEDIPNMPAPTEPDADATRVVKPEMPDIELRQGSGTAQGTMAIAKVMDNPAPKPEVKKSEKKAKAAKAAHSDPVSPIGETYMDKGADTAIMKDLLKLKSERGTKMRSLPKADPVNRASINDIDLGIDKKVIPNTEMGIDENATEEEKLAYLNAKRRERVKEFVAQTEEDEKPKKGSIADFESFDQAEEMTEGIHGLKSSLIARLCTLLVIGIVSGYLTLATDTGLSLMPILAQTTSYLFVSVILGLVACFVSYSVIAVGLKKLFTLKADSDSLASITAIFSIGSGIAMLADPEPVQMKTAHVYISIAILGLLVNTIGKLLIMTRTERNFRYISGGYSKYAAMHIDDEEIAGKFTKGALTDFPSLSTARKTEFVNDFIANSYSADLTDAFSKLYVPIVAGISIVIGIITMFIYPERINTVEQRAFYAVACAAGTMSLCSGMAMMLVANIPLAKASKKYLQSSAVMLGYSAVDKFADTNSVLIDAIDLFPDGMVEIVNLKPAKKASIEEGIIYAASLCCQTESILRPAFYKMIKGKTEMLHPVESYIYEDGLGLSGWIENKRVLFGNRALMESHSIEGMPTVEKEAEYAKGDNVCYLSIGGVLAMIFIVKVKASVSVANALEDLEKQKITVILRSVDSLLSITRLSELFDVTPNTFKLLPFRYHNDYDSQTSYVAEMSSPMIYSGRFASLAMLLIGAKRLQRSATIGVIIQVIAAVIGIILSVIFALAGSFGAMFTGTVVLAYNLVWVLITAIMQSLWKT